MLPTPDALAVARAEVDAEHGTDTALATATAAPRRRRETVVVLAIGWLVFVVGLSILAPLLPFHDPNASDFGAHESPSSAHLFGTDGNGRDVLARVAFGGRASLVIGFATVIIGLSVGGTLGLVAGYYRGRVDGFLSGLFDVMLAVPSLVLLSALVAVLGSDGAAGTTRRIALIVLGTSIVSVPILARITRTSTLAWSQREFVRMALAIGSPGRRVLLREVLPNVVPSMLSLALLAVGEVIVVEGSLSLLGIGVPLPTPSWGNIIAEGKSALDIGAVHLVLAPAAFVFFTVLSLNFLSDHVRRRLDVKESLL